MPGLRGAVAYPADLIVRNINLACSEVALVLSAARAPELATQPRGSARALKPAEEGLQIE